MKRDRRRGREVAFPALLADRKMRVSNDSIEMWSSFHSEFVLLICCAQGSKLFRAKADDHVLGGDFENDDGTGGHSAYEEKYFLAEQCPLKVSQPCFVPNLFPIMDQISLKTPNPKCRRYWCLIEFIDWRYSQSC